MKPIRIPSYLIILILLTISLAFFFGTFRAFNSVNASIPVTGGTFRLEGAAEASLQTVTDVPVDDDEPTPTPAPLPTPPSADTTGIIVLAIFIAAIVLVGAAWGMRKPDRKN